MLKGFSSNHKNALLLSLCAVSVALFIVLLLTTVSFVVYRSADFFEASPIYSIVYENEDNVIESGYAQFRAGLPSDKPTWIAISKQGEVYQKGLSLTAKEIRSIKEETRAAEIRLSDGRVILAIPKSISTEQESHLSMEHYENVAVKVKELQAIIQRIKQLQLSPIHNQLADLDQRRVSIDAPARTKLNEQYRNMQSEIEQYENQLAAFRLNTVSVDGSKRAVPINRISLLTYPSQQSAWQQAKYVVTTMWRFLSDRPKLGNTAGGVFPAFFGTVAMVLLMTVIVAPFGVLTAIYLHEYAPNNFFTGAIRVCISNLAAVPSVVYGVFGLGFLVYEVGGRVDELFFSSSLPSPTFGSPGLLWASLTMALLTLPVVTVATEEGLSRIPTGLKQGSYALGATRLETIWHTVIPIASPSILTGLILAIARAAGEVAPLMLVGAVRFAPDLPIDSEFPFIHLDRQFMHLGVLLYEGGFHSQTSPRGGAMMFATCCLLLITVVALNAVAATMRHQLRRRYQ